MQKECAHPYLYVRPFSQQGDEGHNSSHTVRHRAFHRFRQAKFPDGVLVLGSSQFTPLPQLPLKMMLSLKVVKINS